MSPLFVKFCREKARAGALCTLIASAKTEIEDAEVLSPNRRKSELALCEKIRFAEKTVEQRAYFLTRVAHSELIRAVPSAIFLTSVTSWRGSNGIREVKEPLENSRGSRWIFKCFRVIKIWFRQNVHFSPRRCKSPCWNTQQNVCRNQTGGVTGLLTIIRKPLNGW